MSKNTNRCCKSDRCNCAVAPRRDGECPCGVTCACNPCACASSCGCAAKK